MSEPVNLAIGNPLGRVVCPVCGTGDHVVFVADRLGGSSWQTKFYFYCSQCGRSFRVSATPGEYEELVRQQMERLHSDQIAIMRTGVSDV